ncbi:MAG: imidazoleglycerol-phosphate dehydratase HisB [Planctomycetes bacterium]|nr:imidazoleglycerol-phosphate dehydratase HisB [Planctomycetota bacterium]
MTARTAEAERRTAETSVQVSLSLDGDGRADVRTGVPFYDHLLTALARHAGFDLTIRCDGDLDVDDHHTVEDVAIVLGRCLDEALGDRRGVARFGSAYAPLDEALARAVVDLSGRPFAVVELPWRRDVIGGMAMENVAHALSTLAGNARLCLHLDVLRGDNDHHRCEAAFKALAVALRQAVAVRGDRVPSTKEAL